MTEVVKVSNKNPAKKKDMSFIEHLNELRKYLFRSIIAVLIFAIIAFFFKDIIFDDIIFSPKNPDFITNRLMCNLSVFLNLPAICINQGDFNIINIQMAGQFKAHLLISFIVGVMLAFPYLVAQLWGFVKPALEIKEAKKSRGLLFAVSVLFSVGVSFGYFLIVPLTINFLSTYQVSTEITNQISFSSYMSIISTISLSTGLIFELPILVFFLSKIGILTPKVMRKHRKHAIVVFFILSGIITPPDIFSQFLVSLPLLGLYEVSISISSRVAKKRRIVM